MFARMLGAALFGIEATVVRVEAHGSSGLPAINTVGLPDGAVRESRERVRSAILNSGLVYPQRRLTINLAPAGIRKVGAALDLPVAAAIVGLNEGALRSPVQSESLLMGELSLDGSVLPVPGVLSAALEARARGLRRLLVPAANEAEASVVEGIEVAPVATLAQAIACLNGRDLPPPSLPGRPAVPRAGAPATGAAGDRVDLSEIRGQSAARRALEVAAAGGHNLLMIGPPGTGKTMLARRFPGLLPPMTTDEAIEVTRVAGAAGLLAGGGLVGQRPFRAPHHTASDAALVGGGGGPAGVRPGEVSLAHCGALFLDELPEFHRHVLEALRQPLEEGSVTVARAGRSARFPAAFILLAAMNPCPCGYLGDRQKECLCTPPLISRYRGRVSGPLLDRIDLHVEVPAVAYREIASDEPGEGSAAIRMRVIAARERQRARSSGFSCNACLSGPLLREHCRLDAAGRRLMEAAVTKLGLSARAHDRILKVARTIADLAAQERITRDHLAEAIQYRGLDKLP